jgi:Icc-related predicted phosphoesterase
MRLLLVSDLHYTLPQFDWVLKVADRFDVVVMAGDHLDINSVVDGRAQSAVVRKYFARLKAVTRLVICSGNHDLDARNDQGEKIATWLLAPRNDGVPSDGQSFSFEDTLFTMCPWWDGPIVRARIAEQLAQEAAKRRERRWIWIYHAPPDQSPIAWDGSRYFGEREVRGWIEQYQPDIVLSGHSHLSPFVPDGSWVDRIGNSWVFNTGREFIAPPAHIVIDTEAAEAVWFSSAGTALVRLNEPLVRPVPFLTTPPDWLKDVDRAPDRSQA